MMIIYFTGNFLQIFGFQIGISPGYRKGNRKHYQHLPIPYFLLSDGIVSTYHTIFRHDNLP